MSSVQPHLWTKQTFFLSVLFFSPFLIGIKQSDVMTLHTSVVVWKDAVLSVTVSDSVHSVHSADATAAFDACSDLL